MSKPNLQQAIFKILAKLTNGQYGKNAPTKEYFQKSEKSEKSH